MEDRRLSAYTGLLHGRARVYVGAAIEQESGLFKTAVFRGHMQQCRSLKQKTAGARAAAVEFGESPMRQSYIGIETQRKVVNTPSENVEYPRQVVPGCAVGSEKEVDAESELWRANIVCRVRSLLT